MFNFYMLPSRAWEIAIGALVALITLSKKIRFKDYLINIILFLGFITLLLFLFLFSSEINTPL